MKLSERTIKSEKWDGKDRLLNDGNGLYLNIRRSSKTFVIRKRIQGSMEVETLGKWPDDYSLKKARFEASQRALDGSTNNMTVAVLVEKYQTKVIEKSHKRPHFADGYWRRAVLPLLGRKKVKDIRTEDITAMVESYSETSGGRSADQLLSNVKALFGYAVERGVIKVNPAAAITSRVTGYKYEPRDRVLDDKEIRLLWFETKSNARILRFLLLTGLRIGEAQKGFQDEDKWIVPKEISKNGVAHWVYLTAEAKAQLPLPLCTATNIQAWLRRWCDNHQIDRRFTPHDLRRTAATRMNEIKIEPFIVERVLNHALQGMMKVYNKAEYENERKVAAKLLERHILKIIQVTS